MEETGKIPTRADSVNFPLGGRLINPDLLNALVSFPLKNLLGVAAAYSIVAALELAFAGLAFYLLAFVLTRNKVASIAAGTAYLLFPYTVSYGICSGVPEINTAGFLPLLLYFLIKTVRESGWHNPIMSAISAMLLVLAAPHSVVPAAIIIFLLVLYYLLIAKDPNRDLILVSTEIARRPRFTLALLKRLSLALVLSLLLTLPYLLVVQNSVKSADSLLPRDELAARHDPSIELVLDNYKPNGEFPYVTPLIDFVTPGKNRPITMEEITRFYHSSYLGLAPLILALIGLCRLHNRLAFFLAGLSLLGMLLATGPYLVLARGIGLSSPHNPFFLAFYHAFPQVSFVMEPLRFSWITGIGVYLLAAAGIASLTNGPHRLWIGMGLTVAIIADLVFLSPVPFPYPSTKLEQHPLHQELALDSDRSAILELPAWIAGTSRMPREKFLHQTQHRRPIAANVAGHIAPYLLANQLTRQLFKIESPTRYPDFPKPDLKLAKQGLEQLITDGFGYILLEQRHYLQPVYQGTRKMLDAIAPTPGVEKNGYLIYRLKPETQGDLINHPLKEFDHTDLKKVIR